MSIKASHFQTYKYQSKTGVTRSSVPIKSLATTTITHSQVGRFSNYRPLTTSGENSKIKEITGYFYNYIFQDESDDTNTVFYDSNLRKYRTRSSAKDSSLTHSYNQSNNFNYSKISPYYSMNRSTFTPNQRKGMTLEYNITSSGLNGRKREIADSKYCNKGLNINYTDLQKNSVKREEFLKQLKKEKDELLGVNVNSSSKKQNQYQYDNKYNIYLQRFQNGTSNVDFNSNSVKDSEKIEQNGKMNANNLTDKICQQQRQTNTNQKQGIQKENENIKNSTKTENAFLSQSQQNQNIKKESQKKSSKQTLKNSQKKSPMKNMKQNSQNSTNDQIALLQSQNSQSQNKENLNKQSSKKDNKLSQSKNKGSNKKGTKKNVKQNLQKVINNEICNSVNTENYKSVIKENTNSNSINAANSKSVNKENSKSINKENFKSVKKDNSKSLNKENSKSIKKDNSKSIKTENSKSVKKDNLKSIKAEISKTIKKDNSKSIKNENLESIKKVYSKSVNAVISKSVNTENSKSVKKDNSKSKKTENSKSAKKDNSKSIKNENLESIKKENSKSVHKENSKSKKKDISKSINKEKSESIKIDNSKSINVENSKSEGAENISQKNQLKNSNQKLQDSKTSQVSQSNTKSNKKSSLKNSAQNSQNMDKYISSKFKNQKKDISQTQTSQNEDNYVNSKFKDQNQDISQSQNAQKELYQSSENNNMNLDGNNNNEEKVEPNVSVVKKHEEKTIVLVPGQTIEPKSVTETFENPIEEITQNPDGTTTSLIKQTKIITTIENIPIEEHKVKSVEGAPELPMYKQHITYEYITITHAKGQDKNGEQFNEQNNYRNSGKNKGFPLKSGQKGINNLYGNENQGNINENYNIRNKNSGESGTNEQFSEGNLKNYYSNEENLKKEGLNGNLNNYYNDGNQYNENELNDQNDNEINENEKDQYNFSPNVLPEGFKNEEEFENFLNEINQKGDDANVEEKEKRLNCIKDVFNKMSKDGNSSEQNLEKLAHLLINMNENDKNEILSKLKNDFPNNLEFFNKLLNSIQNQVSKRKAFKGKMKGKGKEKGKGQLKDNNLLGSGKHSELLTEKELLLSKSGKYAEGGFNKGYSGSKKGINIGSSFKNRFYEYFEVKEVNPLKFEGLFLDITKYSNEHKEKNPFEGPSPYCKFYKERKKKIKKKIINMASEEIEEDDNATI